MVHCFEKSDPVLNRFFTGLPRSQLPLTSTSIFEVIAALRNKEIQRQTDILDMVAEGQNPCAAITDDPVDDLELDATEARAPIKPHRRIRRQRAATIHAELEVQVVGKGDMPSGRVRVLRARGSEAPAVEFSEETMLHLLDCITRELAQGERRKQWGADRAEEDRVKSQYVGVYWCYRHKAWLAKKGASALLPEPMAQKTNKFLCARGHEAMVPALEVAAASFARGGVPESVAPALMAARAA